MISLTQISAAAMKSLSRVVWSEGMYLGPHHFQAQSRYFEDSIQFATSALWYESYGMMGCEVDAEALRNGTLALIHARGIFPDGLVFQMPECDPLPVSRGIDELFPPTQDKMLVYLSVPPVRANAPNCAPTDAPAPNGFRYSPETTVLHDETNGRDEKPVNLGRKNIQLTLDVEDAGDMQRIPVARVIRSGSGKFVLDPLFIPPCLQIGGSPRLMNLLERLLEIMEEKSSTLSLSPATAGGLKAGYSTREIANFWFLHAVNSGIVPLRHLFYTKRGHPEELYLELAKLAGALATFALDDHPRTIPHYDHHRPDECFETLDHRIRTNLEMVMPTNCLSIPLKLAGDYLYEGPVTDQRCFGRSSWIFAIRSDLGESDLIARTPQLVKVCSRQFVGELVKRALPGLTLTHASVPPSAVTARVETQYFTITKSGPCWSHLVETRQVGVYLPGEFPSAEIELLVVLDQ